MLSGHSKGGYSALRYAQIYPSDVRAVVAIAPVISRELSFEARRQKDPKKFEEFKERGYVIETRRNGG